MFALYRAVYEVSGDPAMGLKLGTEERIERDALQRVARYKQLTSPEEIQIAERGNECTVQFLWLLSDEAKPAPLIDCCFAWIVTSVEEPDARPTPSAWNSSVRNLSGKCTNLIFSVR